MRHDSGDLLVTVKMWVGGSGVTLVRVDTEKTNEGKREEMAAQEG